MVGRSQGLRELPVRLAKPNSGLGLLLHTERKDIDGAEAANRAAIAADPECTDVHWHLGWLLFEETEDTDGAEAAYRAAIAADPGCADAHGHLGSLMQYLADRSGSGMRRSAQCSWQPNALRAEGRQWRCWRCWRTGPWLVHCRRSIIW